MKTIKLFAVLAVAVFTISSCSKDETEPTPTPTNTDSPYMGNWEGTFDGGDDGTWAMTVDKAGALTGTFYSNNSMETYSYTGNVDSKGAITADISVNGVTLDFSGQASADAKTASGTWGNPSIPITGTWTGAKK